MGLESRVERKDLAKEISVIVARGRRKMEEGEDGRIGVGGREEDGSYLRSRAMYGESWTDPESMRS